MAGAKFERKEVKFLITEGQYKELMRAFPLRMSPDAYGKSTIANIYYDTPDFRLVRRSLERPVYKEKFRIRSYGKAGKETPVFLELKKKYKGIVYKRRTCLPHYMAQRYMSGQDVAFLPGEEQIGREIDYFRRYYRPLLPAVYLCYDREAYFCKEDPDLRITFDTNIRFRQDALSLDKDYHGQQLLQKGERLMEIKAAGAMPLWIVSLLSEFQIRQASFSKYGTAYTRIIQEQDQQETLRSILLAG